ncbi:T-lymphoma invasion and metastasis-inducing protein 2-like, partial [Anarrhichthys ocellatus]|uniref:T-lymphoma invasion and metastasis-inducing protein 2-like n=1 Tax=Anarrhichthys ocellatus TaxID=433405 RepID=UPI0012EEAAEB
MSPSVLLQAAMGNTDSHSGFVSPAKSSSSLRFSSRREEVPSARSWWRSSQGSGRSRVRSYMNQRAADPPYTSWHYEPRATRGGAGSPQRFLRGNQFGFVEGGGERTSVESGSGSPKVLLGKDGSMRVEFTNARGVCKEPKGLLPAAATAVTEPSLRTSKGSSLSSNGSWYDSPWGTGGELVDNVFVCGQSAANRFTEETANNTTTTVFSAQVDVSPGSDTGDFAIAAVAGYNTCSSSGRTEDSGIGDSVILPADLRDFSPASPSSSSLDSVYHNALPAFPTTTPDDTLQQTTTTASSNDVIQEEEGSGGGVEQRYSSVTLPCRRAENGRKDFLKSRIRRLSDWTGSLSRKKRRIQEPNGSDTTDVSVDRPDCSTLWSSNPLHTLNLNQYQFTPAHCGSSRSLNQNQSSDVQRQNVYESFMQELKTGCSSTAERTEEEEEEEEEEVEEGDEEVGGGEQLDVLCEEEQGVVRRAGWLSFKALITVSKDRKLELVARRRWRGYWVTLRGTGSTGGAGGMGSTGTGGTRGTGGTGSTGTGGTEVLIREVLEVREIWEKLGGTG